MLAAPGSPFPPLNRLRAFDRVVAAGSMSAAASLLHVTQSAVSRAVQGLERDIGVRLMDRGRGSFLTPEGRILARRTGRFFQQLDAAIADAIGADAADSDQVARLARKITDVHVRSLVAISTTRSFRGAAKALSVAEPTLHRPARDLERLLKISLYRRTPDGIGLSPVGSELARRLSLAAVELKAGVEEVATVDGAATATMTIGVLALAPKRFLATLTEALLKAHPNATVTIQEGAYDDLVTAMRRGSIDLVLGALRALPPFPDLCEDGLFDDPYCIVCRRDHPLTRLRRPGPPDLKAYDWILPPRTIPRRAVLDELIAAWGLSHRVQIETDSLGALLSMLAASDRISLLPREYVLVEDQMDRLAVLDLHVPHPRRVVGLTTRQDWLPTAFQADFLALARKTRRQSVA